MKPIGTLSGYFKPQEWTKGAEKLKKCEQQITNMAKTQIGEAIKIVSHYLNIMYFYFNFYL